MPTKPSRAIRPGGKQKPAPPKKTKGGAGGHQGRITVPKSSKKQPGAMPKAGKDKVLVMGEVYEKKIQRGIPKPKYELQGKISRRKTTTKKRKPE